MANTATQSTQPIHDTGTQHELGSPLVARGDVTITSTRSGNGATLQALLELRHLLAAEWTADILIVLQTDSHRYAELLDKVRSSHVVDPRTGRSRYAQARTFILTLRRMEAVGLVHRSELQGVWPREVHYTLTAAALELLGALASTVTWCERHQPLGAQTDQQHGGHQQIRR